MLKLTIDRGNSATKIGFFDQSKLVAVHSIPNDDKEFITTFISTHQPEAAIISSVADDFDLGLIQKKVKNIVVLDHQTPLPFSNMYNTPETLGKDRIAAVAGAQQLYPQKSVFVIDAGTAITYDVLLGGNKYAGGDISPGMAMRFKALNTFTSRLPLVTKDEPHQFPGKKTTHAIASGVINGMIFEIEGYRAFCKNNWDIDITILTGGDSDFFAGKLKKPIFVNQNLVLVGLNRILEYNA